MDHTHKKSSYIVRFSWQAFDNWLYTAQMIVKASTNDEARQRAERRISYLTDTPVEIAVTKRGDFSE